MLLAAAWNHTGRCIWHADEDAKPRDAFETAWPEPGERLDGAILRGASLAGAEFSACRFIGADFAGAIVRDADFSGADLRRATFRDTDARRASFDRSTIEDAQFVNADLREELPRSTPRPRDLLKHAGGPEDEVRRTRRL
ncbi:pentapeptide repeat-containing protein [Saliphagus sp. GCM10025308]